MISVRRAALGLSFGGLLLGPTAPQALAAETTVPGTLPSIGVNDNGASFTPSPFVVLGRDSVSGAECWVGATATCALPGAGGGGGGGGGAISAAAGSFAVGWSSEITQLLTAAQAGTASFGSVLPSSGIAVGVQTDAGLTAPIGCDQSAWYDASTSGESQLVAAVAGKAIYICGYHLFSGGTVNVNLDDYSGSTHSKITPAFPLTAQTGAVDGSPFFRGLKVSAGDALYLNASGAIAVQAIVYYTQF